ncbi:alpha/beta-hydrolase [Pluteus cervinus]|uniref:Alpha/beta-hydrolase n=1 Tax=Pluteus cervinus TaxID=181527 RepID=A0ACD3BAT0_9AGAR|nr:alpha/beta-hydrolase [Pluteus cervinus]
MLTINVSGIAFEADWIHPDESREGDATKVAICLHPWSWLGGQMNDPVILSLVEPLQIKGYHILRYNSRGVGRSTGWSSLTGLSEGDDLQAVMSWTQSKCPNLSSLVLLGYSHGSLIACLPGLLPPPVKTSHILLSYPLGPRSWLTCFRSQTYQKKLQELVQNPESNILVVFGDQDEFTSASQYQDWGRLLESLVADEGNKRLQIVEVPQATHFWRGRDMDALVEKVSGWLP